MNIVCSGDVYQIYGDGIATYQTLPAKVYEVGFSKMTGFYLTSRSDMSISEEKIYGDYARKVNKVLTGYKAVDRNFGVILSGPKGVGKSLFAKVLSVAAESENFPVIVVSHYVPGIANFLASIDQDVIVLFDEFEKTFARQEDHGPTPQDEMLSLFDGLEGGHKLFIVTCNEVDKLSNYLLNRPGRFHYHFTLDAPTADEIKEYLIDKLVPTYHDQIDYVVRFSKMGRITYDCLRAIAFELNMGYSLAETVNELNLVHEQKHFDLIFEMNDGSKYTVYNLHGINIFGEHSNEVFSRWIDSYGRDPLAGYSIRFVFDVNDMQVDDETAGFSIPVDKISLYFDSSDFPEGAAVVKMMETRIAQGIKSAKIIPSVAVSTKYTV